MTRTTIRIEATIDTPDTVPVVDYIRAVGNYLVDTLPKTQVDSATLVRKWSAGVHVTLETKIKITDDQL